MIGRAVPALLAPTLVLLAAACVLGPSAEKEARIAALEATIASMSPTATATPPPSPLTLDEKRRILDAMRERIIAQTGNADDLPTNPDAISDEMYRSAAQYLGITLGSSSEAGAQTPTTAPTPTPRPTATPTPQPIPTYQPMPTSTPNEAALWQQGYDAGYLVGANCVSPNPRVSGDSWNRGYQTGFNAGRQNACTPSPTPTPRPERLLTAPKAVWDCFLARDDSQRDEHGTVLSPCGWVEYDGRVYKWRSPVNVNVFTSTESVAERERWLTQAALDELAPLLRLEFNMVTDLPWSNNNAINLRFIDTSSVPCGEGTQFHGCAEGHRTWTDEIAIAAHAGDRGLRRILRHELLHLLAYMAHAHQGIMSTGRHWDGSYELTDMDRAQLWLYSNPLIRSGMSLDEVQRMARYGDWQ